MKKHILIALIGTSLALPFAVQAEGSYAGVNVGRAEQKLNIDGLGSIKESDTGFKLYGGHDFTKNFGAEIGFVDFGKASITDGTDTVSAKPKSFYAAATGTLPLNEQFSLTAKAGFSYNRVELSATGVSDTTENRTSGMVGIGAVYNFDSKFSAVLEYENFGKIVDEDGGNLKADLISVGVRYKF